MPSVNYFTTIIYYIYYNQVSVKFEEVFNELLQLYLNNNIGWFKKVEFCDFYMNLGPENFFLKMTTLGVILYIESIICIPKARKRFRDPDSGKNGVFIKAKIEKFRFFTSNRLYRDNFMRGIDYAHSRCLKMFPWLWFRENYDLQLTFSFQNRSFLWIRAREAFSGFGNAHNRFST